MALKYTEEKLDSLDKETLIQLFLSQQEQLENIDRTLQLVLEQMADLKRHRFGRSSERHEPDEQISFMEADGKIVFFNESEAVAAEESGEDTEPVPRRKPKKKQKVILAVCEACHTDVSEIAAFGDDYADMGMLKLCGIGVAMDNAVQEVKDIADDITLSNEEDGVAAYLEKWII